MKEQVVTRSLKLSNEIFLSSVVELLQQGKLVKINVSGGSMRPFLKDGDTILLGYIDFDTVRFGDILLCKYRGEYVLHRMVGKDKNCIYLAGDNNLRYIEKILAKDVYAIAKALVHPKGDVNLESLSSKFKGLVWYYLRPFRRVYSKIFN